MERRKVWIHEMRRVSSKNTTWTPGESDMVCSEHYVDGHSTVENPDPTLHLGYITDMMKQRRGLVRQAEHTTSEPVEECTACVSMDSNPAEDSSCASCANLRTQNGALQDEIEVLRAENFKLTKNVDQMSQEL